MNVFILLIPQIAVKKNDKWRFYNEKRKSLFDFELKEINIYKMKDLYIRRKYEYPTDYLVQKSGNLNNGF